MSKGFKTFPITEKFLPSHGYLLENDKNALSLNADKEFPESPLEGMLCYRTDEEKVYIYKKVGWVEILNLKDLPLVQKDFAKFKKTYNTDTEAFTKRVDDKFVEQDSKLSKLDKKLVEDVDAKIKALGKYANANSINYEELTNKPDLKGMLNQVKEQITWNKLQRKPLEFKPEKHSIERLTDLKKYGKQDTVDWADVRHSPDYILSETHTKDKEKLNSEIEKVSIDLQKTQKDVAKTREVADAKTTQDNVEKLLNDVCDTALKGAGEHLQPLNDINPVNYAELVNKVEQLQNKLNNIDKYIAPSSSRIYIVETGKSDNGWWRKWSDGWLEQGGDITWNSNGWQETTISFPKRFKDLSYHWTGQSSWNDNSFAVTARYNANNSKRLNGLTVYSVFPNDSKAKQNHLCTWYACGYGE